MKAHVSSSAQEPIKEAALKKVISNAKVGAVEMFFMFRDLIVNMLDEGVKDVSESVRENKINAAVRTAVLLMSLSLICRTMTLL